MVLEAAVRVPPSPFFTALPMEVQSKPLKTGDDPMWSASDDEFSWVS